MIENYVLSGFFVAHFPARGHTFSSQLLTPHISFHLFMSHFSFQPFTQRVSAQLSGFKLTCPALQFAPARQKGSHSFYSRSFRSANFHYSSPVCLLVAASDSHILNWDL